MNPFKKYTLEEYENLCKTDGLEEAEQKLEELEGVRKETNKAIREQKALIKSLKNARDVMYLKAHTPDGLGEVEEGDWATSLVGYMQSLGAVKIEADSDGVHTTDSDGVRTSHF